MWYNSCLRHSDAPLRISYINEKQGHDYSPVPLKIPNIYNL